MAILDSQLVLANNLSLVVASPGIASPGIIDLAGVGAGNAPPNAFGISNTVFGEDIGIGDGMSPPNITCIIGTSFVAAGGATLNVQLQEAVDSGTPTYQPGTWVTVVETGAMTPSTTAGALLLQAGQKIAEFTVPPRRADQAFPRFLRLFFAIAAGNFTAGVISFAGIATGRDDIVLYPAGY